MGEHMAFIQLIEVTSSRVSEIEALTEEWRAQTEGQRTAVRGTLTQDRDRPGTYLQIVEFGSYEDAMANSRLPATAAFAARLAALCDGPPVCRNLDVISSVTRAALVGRICRAIRAHELVGSARGNGMSALRAFGLDGRRSPTEWTRLSVM